MNVQSSRRDSPPYVINNLWAQNRNALKPFNGVLLTLSNKFAIIFILLLLILMTRFGILSRTLIQNHVKANRTKNFSCQLVQELTVGLAFKNLIYGVYDIKRMIHIRRCSVNAFTETWTFPSCQTWIQN